MPEDKEERKTPSPPAPPNPSEIPARVGEFIKKIQGGIGTFDKVLKQMDRSFRSLGKEKSEPTGELEKLISSLSESDKKKLVKSIKEKTEEKLKEE